jgi:eukaryotic-like serine/threonine-protein kinase
MDLEKVKAIFAEAAAMDSAEAQAAYLDRACGGDALFREKVESLLTARGKLGSFLEGPLFQHQNSADSPPLIGTRIGPYKILEQIGEGGFGLVFLAGQEQPIRRQVALKIIKAGMDTGQVIARFEAERQALAMMDHPNIAKVLDAGETTPEPNHKSEIINHKSQIPSGRPYFVMELARGLPITQFCNEQNLETQTRLELFIQVCHAVQHAHQKGIIHRDLKPSNVMITMIDGEPVPKVIDFGVAKAIEQRLTERTLFTSYGQMIGTPACMSPEQADLSGQDVDTRSDIYSLGCLLYELLTGTPPIDQETLRKAGLDEIRRLIRETDPPRPSTRLARNTSAGGATRSQIPNQKYKIENDLDWIVMKCLEKDRRRRYETVNGLAMDLQRHLNEEPVVARPPTATYRLKKFARRNRTPVAFGSSVVVALVLGLILSLMGFAEARRERDRALAAERQADANEQKAEAEALQSAQVAELLKNMLRGAGPKVALGRDATLLRELLDQTAAGLQNLGSHHAVEADLRSTLGQVYSDLGAHGPAEAMHRQALEIRRRVFGNDHLEVADSLHALAWVMFQVEKYDEAVLLFGEALAIKRARLGESHESVAKSLYGLARMHAMDQNQLSRSEALHREALAMRAQLFAGDHPAVAQSLHGLGIALRDQEKYFEAHRFMAQGLAMRRNLFGDAHLDVAGSLMALAHSLREQGKPEEAEVHLREALVIQRTMLGDVHPVVARSLNVLSHTVARLGRLDEAGHLNQEQLALRTRILFDQHPAAPSPGLDPLAWQTGQGGLHVTGAALPSPPSVESRSSSGSESARAHALRKTAMTLRSLGRFDEARRAFLEAAATGDPDGLDRAAWFLATCADPTGWDGHTAVSLAERAAAASGRRSGRVLDTLAAAYAAAGRFAEAIRIQQEAIALIEDAKTKEEYGGRLRLFESNAPYLAYFRLGHALRDQGKLDQAEAAYRHELEMRAAMYGLEHLEVAGSLYDLAFVLCRQDKYADAVQMHRRALALRRTRLPEKHSATLNSLSELVLALIGLGELGQAETLAREHWESRREKAPDHWQTFEAQSILGGILARQKKHDEAEPLLLSGYQGLIERRDTIPPANHARLKAALERLAQFYQETNRREPAAEWELILAELQ